VQSKQELLDKLNQIIHRLNQVNGEETKYLKKISFVGKGAQGAVYKIDAKRCVKIYVDTKHLKRELSHLQLGNTIGICPKVFLWGEDYIVMEYFSSPPLYEYLKKNPLTKELAAKIIELLDSFEAIGFNRLDHALRHIYMLPDGKLKIIDVVNSIKSVPIPLPERIMKDLGANAHDFFQFVQEISPKWYLRWTSHPDFPELMEKTKGRGQPKN
jgi:predicted Ser/Thr protein kinase